MAWTRSASGQLAMRRRLVAQPAIQLAGAVSPASSTAVRYRPSAAFQSLPAAAFLACAI
jgi:hypothetical protein